MKLAELSYCEMLTMRCIWAAKKDVTIIDIKELFKQLYGRDYERSTICTFVARLEKKGYVVSRTKLLGKGFFYHPALDEAEYRRWMQQQFLEFWFQGSLSDFVTSYCQEKKLSAEELKEIRTAINGMERRL